MPMPVFTFLEEYNFSGKTVIPFTTYGNGVWGKSVDSIRATLPDVTILDVANFRLREGMAIGAKVTLRGDRMYDFLDKLINVSLPRVRDFRGVSSKSFDGRGNYTLGIKEQLIFPEIDYDKVNRVRGLDVVIVTTANTDEEARELLTDFGMPFTK